MSDVRCQMPVKRTPASLNFQLTSDIWHLTSSSWRNYADPVAGPALRRANVAEKARLHIDRHAHTRPGHRREHGDLQHHQTDFTASAALPGIRTAGHFAGGAMGLS